MIIIKNKLGSNQYGNNEQKNVNTTLLLFHSTL